MSWIDLAVLTLVLWGAVWGYTGGARGAMERTGSVVVAVYAAFLLQRPLIFFLNSVWDAERVFIRWSSRNIVLLRQVGVSDDGGICLPPLNGYVAQTLGNPTSALPAAGYDYAWVMLGKMFYYLFALLIAALLIYIFLNWAFSIKRNREKLPSLKGRYFTADRTLGAAFGAIYGLLSAFLTCIVLEAVSLHSSLFFLLQDLTSSYAYNAIGQLFQ